MEVVIRRIEEIKQEMRERQGEDLEDLERELFQLRSLIVWDRYCRPNVAQKSVSNG